MGEMRAVETGKLLGRPSSSSSSSCFLLHFTLYLFFSWMDKDVPAPKQDNHQNEISYDLIGLKPFTQYAYFIKTYAISSERSGARSGIQYFITNPGSEFFLSLFLSASLPLFSPVEFSKELKKIFFLFSLPQHLRVHDPCLHFPIRLRKSLLVGSLRRK